MEKIWFWRRLIAKELGGSAASPLNIDDFRVRLCGEESHESFRAGEENAHLGPDPFATFKFHFAAVVVDDAMDDEQAQAGPCLLGGVIGFENPTDLIGRNPGAVVSKGDEDIFIIAAGSYRQFTTRAHRLATVADEIVEDLLQLILIDVEEGKFVFQLEGHGDAAVGELGSDEGECLVDEVV